MGETLAATEVRPSHATESVDMENLSWQGGFPAAPEMSGPNPLLKHSRQPLGTLEPVEWIDSAPKPELSLIETPIPGVENSSENQSLPEPDRVIVGPDGGEWLDLGSTPAGQHKIATRDGLHTKFMEESSFQELINSQQDSSNPASVETSQGEEDPEKQQMRDTIEELTSKLGQMEERVAKLESEVASQDADKALTVDGNSRKVYGPEDEISAFIGKKREENLARLEKINSKPSARFHSAWERARTSLAQNAKRGAGAIAGKSMDITKSTVEAASPYIKKAAKPIGLGMMYGEVLAENGPRLASEAERKIIDTSQRAIEIGKNTIGVGGAMAQVAGEEAVQIARDSITRGVIAGKMTGENIKSTAESIRSNRQRRICEVVGAGVMMWSVFFGPRAAETDSQPSNEDQEEATEKVEAPPVAI